MKMKIGFAAGTHQMTIDTVTRPMAEVPCESLIWNDGRGQWQKYHVSHLFETMVMDLAGALPMSERDKLSSESYIDCFFAVPCLWQVKTLSFWRI